MKIKAVTLEPVVHTPVIDKLTYLLPYRLGKADGVPKKVRKRIEALIATGTCLPWFPSGGSYACAFAIPLAKAHQAKVQIGALKANQKGGLRVSLNPRKAGKKGIKELHRVLRMVVGSDRYDELLTAPLVNGLDVAVDVHNVVVRNLTIDYARAQRLTVFGKRIKCGSHIETWNFGSLTSDYFMSVYDKRAELMHQALKAVAQGGIQAEKLSANAVKFEAARDGVEQLRIEVRCRKLRGLQLHALVHQQNRFLNFRFGLLNSLDFLSQFDQDAFRALYEQRGLRGALQAFKDRPELPQLRRRSVQAPAWWRPQELWVLACEQLKGIGLFPDEAFEEPDETDED